MREVCERCETHGSVGALEHVELALGGGVGVLGHDGLQDVLCDLPDLLVLLLEQQDDARRLRVEGAGHVLDGLGDELLDARIADGALGLERVVRAAVLDRLDEGRS